MVLRLSAAERLAKDLKPTFIYVLHVKPDLAIATAHLIEIKDAVLATILKRLRVEHAKGRTKINNLEITFDVRKVGVEIAPTGRAFRETVEQRCGDLTAYVTEKSRQIKELGFEDGRYELSCNIVASGMEELVDGFMGFSPLKATTVTTVERRFGIPLELMSTTSVKSASISKNSAVLNITPRAAECEVVVRGRFGDKPARFNGSLFVPALKVPREFYRAVFKCAFFEIEIRNDVVRLRQPENSVMATRERLEEWISFQRFLIALAEGVAKIELTPKLKALPPINIPFHKKLGVENSPRHRNNLRLLEAAIDLLELAGAVGGRVPLSELVDHAADILAVRQAIHQPEDGFVMNFETSNPNGVALTDSGDALYVNFMPVAGVWIGYSAVLDLKFELFQDSVRWRGETKEIREMRAFRDFPEGYAEFVASEKTECGLKSYVVREPELSAPVLSLAEQS